MSAAALFVVGLLGGVHCLGMCGGVVTALTVRLPGERPRHALQLAYHAGRLSTYAALGALAGGFGSTVLLMEQFMPVQTGLYVAAQLMLIALGLYLAGVPRYLAPFENAGRRLWRCVQPAASALFPARTAPRAYVIGLVWGLVPCGLVYSALAVAMVSGGALEGAALLAAFGAGTLPSLLAMGSMLPLLQKLRRSVLVRQLAGALIASLGLVGLAHSAGLQSFSRIAALCASFAS